MKCSLVNSWHLVIEMTKGITGKKRGIVQSITTKIEISLRRPSAMTSLCLELFRYDDLTKNKQVYIYFLPKLFPYQFTLMPTSGNSGNKLSPWTVFYLQCSVFSLDIHLAVYLKNTSYLIISLAARYANKTLRKNPHIVRKDCHIFSYKYI